MITSYFLSREGPGASILAQVITVSQEAFRLPCHYTSLQSQIRGDWGRVGRDLWREECVPLYLSFLTFCLFLEEVEGILTEK